MKEKLTIYLFRHGEKDSNGKFLSKRGIKQAKCLSRRFNKIKIDKIYSSDLDRCKQTSDIINKKHKLPIIYCSELREVKGKVKEFPKKHKKEIKKIERVYKKISREKGHILVSSSGIANRILISMFMKIEPNKANFIQNPTGLTIIDKNLNGNKFRILCVNDTSHLPNKLKIRQEE